MRILTLPDDEKVLRTPSDPVTTNTDWKEVVQAMWQALFESPTPGVGLSAIQIGVPLRIFITILGGKQQIYINPTLIRTDEPYIPGVEGCLSVPEKQLMVQRFKGILIQPLALKPFPKRTVYLIDFAARVIQHELNHLDGKLFIDKEAP